MLHLITLPFRILTGILGFTIGLILFLFWAWCVYDCLTRLFSDPSKKGIWMAILLISLPLGLSWLAAMIYVIFGREQRVRF